MQNLNCVVFTFAPAYDCGLVEWFRDEEPALRADLELLDISLLNGH